jgi:hypothetical protein
VTSRAETADPLPRTVLQVGANTGLSGALVTLFNRHGARVPVDAADHSTGDEDGFTNARCAANTMLMAGCVSAG